MVQGIEEIRAVSMAACRGRRLEGSARRLRKSRKKAKISREGYGLMDKTSARPLSSGSAGPSSTGREGMDKGLEAQQVIRGFGSSIGASRDR